MGESRQDIKYAVRRSPTSGVSALLQALEAKHSWWFGVVAVGFSAPVILPAFLMRALSRGVRQNFEVKGTPMSWYA